MSYRYELKMRLTVVDNESNKSANMFESSMPLKTLTQARVAALGMVEDFVERCQEWRRRASASTELTHRGGGD